MCSTEQFRKCEISFLKNVFVGTNGFPSRIVNKTVREINRKMREESLIEQNPVVQEPKAPSTDNAKEKMVSPYICLPYKGVLGENVVSKFRNVLSNALPVHVKPRFIFKGKKLGSYFRVKDHVPFEHQSDLVYAFRPESNSKHSIDYIGETNVRFGPRTYEHCFADKQSSIFKHKRCHKGILKYWVGDIINVWTVN